MIKHEISVKVFAVLTDSGRLLQTLRLVVEKAVQYAVVYCNVTVNVSAAVELQSGRGEGVKNRSTDVCRCSEYTEVGTH